MDRQIQSKADRDRIRQRAGQKTAKLDAIQKILKDYAQGRAASACMVDIARVLKGAV